MAGVKGKGGQRGRSGRKSRAEELGLVAMFDRCVTKEDREACLLKLAEDCKSDDFHERHESRKLLLAYIYGKPKESLQVGGEGGGPIEIVVKHVKRKPID